MTISILKKEEASLLRVRDLRKVYKGKKILFRQQEKEKIAIEKLELTIKKGEIVGLVGESGCGKSTTGKAIMSLIESTEGRVEFNQQVIFDVKNKIKCSKKEMIVLRKEMQIIFQNPYLSLNPRFTVIEAVREGVKKHKLCKNKKEEYERCEAYLLMCGIDKQLHYRYPRELSGGQRQRVCIARALVIQPQFIVCDEPVASLDVSVQSQILNLLLELKKEHALTLLFISHNLLIVKNFCDTILVMYEGEIIERGRSKDIYENPLHPYTQVLIESIPSIHGLQKEKLKRKNVYLKKEKANSFCKFYQRCSKRSEKCLEKKIKETLIDEGHFVTCCLYEERGDIK